MYNDILTIGPVTIHGYGLMIAIGVLAAFFMASYRAKKRGLSSDTVFNVGLIALAFGIFGAKLMFCIIEFKALFDNPWRVLAGSGFVVYGGLIGGALAVFIYCKKRKIDFLAYFDIIMPSIAVAQGFGRIGCFLAGCCYGHETDSILGVVFHNSVSAPNGVSLLPTQLFSSGGDFLIALMLVLYARRERKAGTVGALYLILYSVGRFVIEFFRADYRGSVGPLSTSQFISIFTLALGVAMFIIVLRRPDSVEEQETVTGAPQPDLEADIETDAE